jgi:hypothetical protein
MAKRAATQVLIVPARPILSMVMINMYLSIVLRFWRILLGIAKVVLVLSRGSIPYRIPDPCIWLFLLGD